MSGERLYDVLVLGGVPAGMTAALYAKRANLRVALLETNVTGGLVNSTYTVENFPSYPEIHGMKLMENIRGHIDQLGVNVEEILEIAGLELATKKSYAEKTARSGRLRCSSLPRTASPSHWMCPPNAISSTSAPSATEHHTKAGACSWSAAATAPSTKVCTSSTSMSPN